MSVCSKVADVSSKVTDAETINFWLKRPVYHGLTKNNPLIIHFQCKIDISYVTIIFHMFIDHLYIYKSSINLINDLNLLNIWTYTYGLSIWTYGLSIWSALYFLT